jgi:hypothetical protein
MIGKALAYLLRPSVAARVVLGCLLLLALPLEWQLATHVFHLPWYLAWTVPVIVELHLAVALEHRTSDRPLAISLFLGSLMLSGTVHLVTTSGQPLPWWLPGAGQLVFLTVGTVAAVRVVLLWQRSTAAAGDVTVAPVVEAPATRMPLFVEPVAPPAPRPAVKAPTPAPVAAAVRVADGVRVPDVTVAEGDRDAARAWAREWQRLNGRLPLPAEASDATGLPRPWWKDTLRTLRPREVEAPRLRAVG